MKQFANILLGWARKSAATVRVALLALVAAAWCATAVAADLRFPPPEFESGYVMPKTQNPSARMLWLEYGDVVVLALVLGVATWAVHKKRSRKWVVGTAIFSLLYFGFYRQGCVCAIGSIQNVALGLSNRGYAVPLGVLGFFALPLVTALFFGRTFCAAACPHGALQDLVLLKPIKIPTWLEQGLGIIPFIYLGLAALFAATGSAFIICEFDPFIPLFRLSGSTTALAIAASFLVAGLFIGRPYCRFLCPYGALLRMGSIFSRWRVRITPDTCTQCTLCAESCPYGVIREPASGPATPKSVGVARRRLLWGVAALPAIIALAALGGYEFANAAARIHPDVRLAEMHMKQQAPSAPALPPKDQIALSRVAQNEQQLMQRANTARRQIQLGGWVFGGWIGLVVALKTLAFAAGQRRTEFEPERSGCFGCARCFLSCPQERLRIGMPITPVPVETAAAEATVSSK